MDLGLQGKVALVTAASKGLGRGIAMELAREGAHLCICAREEGAIAATAAEIRQQTGARVLARTADVANPADIAALVAAARAEFGGIDILVSNSGGPPPGQFKELNDDQWLAAVNLLLMSAVRLTRAVLPDMEQKGWGRILYVTSGSVKQPIKNLILSNSIRAAVTGMAKTLAGEVARQGITVNCLAPGRIDTDRVRQLDEVNARRAGKTVEEIRAGFAQTIPAGRYGTVEEFGRAAAFLCSTAASYVTGTTFLVDGGNVNTLV